MDRFWLIELVPAECVCVHHRRPDWLTELSDVMARQQDIDSDADCNKLLLCRTDCQCCVDAQAAAATVEALLMHSSLHAVSVWPPKRPFGSRSLCALSLFPSAKGNSAHN